MTMHQKISAALEDRVTKTVAAKTGLTAVTVLRVKRGSNTRKATLMTLARYLEIDWKDDE